MKIERIATKDQQEVNDLARTLLILANFDWIQKQAEVVGVSIVPLKGIDLLQSLYAEQLERHVTDIDLLCKSEDDCRTLVAQLCQEEYRLEFPFALRPEVLASKKKVSLLSCNTTKVNVDVHTAFVTKKFFSQTIGSFNTDAVKRCENGRMEELDKWLFLAQHAAFHGFSNSKWAIDLKLLYDRLSKEQKEALRQKANTYGFKRVVIAGVYHILKDDPDAMQRELARMHLISSERRFLYFIKVYDRPFSRNIVDRLVTAYWEFTFISSRRHRLMAWLHLLFPSKGLLTNIYRIKSTTSIIFFYPLNLFISGLTSTLFGILYLTVCIKNAIAHE